MSTKFSKKCVDKASSMKETVESRFNSLHDTHALFDFASINSNNQKKSKKITPVLRKEGFEFLSNL